MSTKQDLEASVAIGNGTSYILDDSHEAQARVWLQHSTLASILDELGVRWENEDEEADVVSLAALLTRVVADARREALEEACFRVNNLIPGHRGEYVVEVLRALVKS